MKEIIDLVQAGRDVFTNFRLQSASRSVVTQDENSSDTLSKVELPHPDPLEMGLGQEVFPFSDPTKIIREDDEDWDLDYKTSHAREGRLTFTSFDGSLTTLNIGIYLFPWAD